MPEAVIASCNAETGEEVVKGTEQGRFPGEPALLHLILQEGTKVGGKADELAGHNKPFCGDILVPLDDIAVVHGEQVVGVVWLHPGGSPKTSMGLADSPKVGVHGLKVGTRGHGGARDGRRARGTARKVEGGGRPGMMDGARARVDGSRSVGAARAVRG